MRSDDYAVRPSGVVSGRVRKRPATCAAKRREGAVHRAGSPATPRNLQFSGDPAAPVSAQARQIIGCSLTSVNTNCASWLNPAAFYCNYRSAGTISAYCAVTDAGDRRVRTRPFQRFIGCVFGIHFDSQLRAIARLK